MTRWRWRWPLTEVTGSVIVTAAGDVLAGWSLKDRATPWPAKDETSQAQRDAKRVRSVSEKSSPVVAVSRLRPARFQKPGRSVIEKLCSANDESSQALRDAKRVRSVIENQRRGGAAHFPLAPA
jgi:hypothetical protein